MSLLRRFFISLALLLISLAPASAAFLNAWQITDASSAAGSTNGYTTNLIASQSTAAFVAGFRYTLNARLVDDFGGTESLGFSYCTGTNRFSVLLDLDAGGNLLALFPTNGGPNTTLTLTTNSVGARAYHTHEIIYSASTKLATYSFDGTALTTWSGDGTTGILGQVFWGATSDAGQGQMNFRVARLQVNNTNIVFYESGSSTTNRPVATDPVSRGWTFSGLGTGTGTNAVSPDTFWQPTILLNGLNPMLTPWTSPFVDPGATVSASPVSVEAGRFLSLALKADGTVGAWGDFSAATNLPPNLTNIIALAAGDSHGLALKSDGTIIAWGDNSLGQTNVPASATNILAIAAGQNHNLALRSNNTVVQWGNDAVITNTPASVTNVVAIAAGQLHNVAVRANGTVVAWGYSPLGQTNVPSGATGVIGIAAGNHTLALRTNRTVLAWGDNTSFQTNVPSAASNVIAIAAGLSHSLALQTNGTVIAWGAGTNNTGVAPNFGQSIVPASATNIVAIAAGDYHSLALRADGTIIAWGAGTNNTGISPNFGQSIIPAGLSTLNLAVTTNSTVNTAVPGNYTVTYSTTNSFNAVSVATRTVVVIQLYPTLATLPAAMTNGTARINGTVNPNGFATTAWFEWGLGSRFDQTTSLASVGTGSNPVALSANLPGLTPGVVYRCRIVASNSVGLVARAYDVAFLSPIGITLAGPNPLTNIWGIPYVDPGVTATGFPVSVTGGRVDSLALKADGSVAGWGDNFYGQTTPPTNTTDLIALASGQHHSVGVRANGNVVGWGDNSMGQLNVAVGATNVVAIVAGESFNLALRRNASLVGWGDDFYGQATAPAFVTNIAAVAAGQRHSLALFVNGDIAAWGYNGFNQTNIPVGATNIRAVAAGAGHSLALKADGTVLAWGLNSYNQTNVPPSVTNVIAIASGFYHNLALRANGTVVAWGAGTNNTGATPHFGQSVVPASATNIVAIGAGYYHSLAIKADGTVIAWGAGTANTGSFPSLGQAIPTAGLSNLNNLALNTTGTVNVNLAGTYPLTYVPTNPFGGGGGGSLARTVIVTDAPAPPVIATLTVLGNGAFQFNFTNATPINFTVLAATNIDLPVSNWTVLGPATQFSPGVYQFTDPQTANFPQRFYQIRSP